MARISFLFLIALCMYYAFDRPVFAQLMEVVLQDTVKKKNGKDTLRLDTIQVDPKDNTAERQFNEKKESYSAIYASGDTRDMVNLPKKGGIGLSINKLYNKFSRKGRHARKLQRGFESEYESDLIRAEWYPLTTKYTTLSGDSLRKFRQYYTPSLQWVQQLGNYEKVAYIQKCLKNYLDSVEIIHKQLQLPMDEVRL